MSQGLKYSFQELWYTWDNLEKLECFAWRQFAPCRANLCHHGTKMLAKWQWSTQYNFIQIALLLHRALWRSGTQCGLLRSLLVVTVFPTDMPELDDYLNGTVSNSISLDKLLGDNEWRLPWAALKISLTSIPGRKFSCTTHVNLWLNLTLFTRSILTLRSLCQNKIRTAHSDYLKNILDFDSNLDSETWTVKTKSSLF